MKVVGLTGGIACGKSTVSRVLSQAPYKIPIIDADEISHAVMAPGTGAYYKVIKAFAGEDIFVASEGKDADPSSAPREIDRKKLGDLIFNNDGLKRKLVGIMNPAIAIAIGKALVWHFFTGTRVIVLDVPLLFETGMHHLCHQVVCVVISDSKEQLKRLMARDGRGEADAKARLASQKLSAKDKADLTIALNDHDPISSPSSSSSSSLLVGLVVTNDDPAGQRTLEEKVKTQVVPVVTARALHHVLLSGPILVVLGIAIVALSYTFFSRAMLLEEEEGARRRESSTAVGSGGFEF